MMKDSMSQDVVFPSPADLPGDAAAFPFAAAIFDMDGLLIDSERPILDAWIKAADELGLPLAADALLHALGRRAEDARVLFRAAFPAEFPFDRARARVQALLSAQREQAGFAVKQGVAALLVRLAERGIPCAVASSTRRAEVERRLAAAGLAPYFGALVGGDEVEHGKPAPDTFLLAARRLEVDPARCVVFEDMEHGARGALAAGMQAVLVPDLKQPSDEVRTLCLSVLTSLELLDPHFSAWFGPR
jgi:HAD superfamily hydrolase (TIGR01509 family)